MCNARTCLHQEGLVHKLGGTNYHRYHIFFCLKIKQRSTPYLSFGHRWHPLTRETRSDKFWVFSKMAHHPSLIPRSSRLFKMAVESNSPPWGSLQMSKSQPMCTLRSQISLGCPTPPILGQTIDRCITSQLRLKPWVVVWPWHRTPASRARTLCWATKTDLHSLTQTAPMT